MNKGGACEKRKVREADLGFVVVVLLLVVVVVVVVVVVFLSIKRKWFALF